MLVIAAIVMSAFASAQGGGFGTPVNLAFRAGFVYSLDDFTRSVTGDMIGVGAEFYLERSLFEGGETTFSADWMGRGANGDKGNMFTLMLNQRFYTGGDYQSANRTYFYVGAGMAIIDVVSTNTVPAVRFGLGSEFGEHVYGEATLVYSDSSTGARATSVGVYLGYRF